MVWTAPATNPAASSSVDHERCEEHRILDDLPCLVQSRHPLPCGVRGIALRNSSRVASSEQEHISTTREVDFGCFGRGCDLFGHADENGFRYLFLFHHHGGFESARLGCLGKGDAALGGSGKLSRIFSINGNLIATGSLAMRA